MRALILDDESPAREGLRKLLQAHPDVRIVGEAARVEAALKLVELRRPDLVFVDVQLRGETGFDFVTQARPPLPYLVFVTAHENFAVDAFRTEAVDYLLKPVEPGQLAEALRRIRQRMNPRQVAMTGPEILRSLGLTVREAEVLYWIAQGKTNREIARILGTSMETVKKQVQGILVRLQVENRVSAASIATRLLQS